MVAAPDRPTAVVYELAVARDERWRDASGMNDMHTSCTVRRRRVGTIFDMALTHWGCVTNKSPVERTVEGSCSPKANALLAHLPDSAYVRLLPHLELVHLQPGAVLSEPEEVVRHLLFPVSGLIGRLAMTSEGKSTELSVCGAEGMLGVSLLLGGRGLSSTAIVLAEGDAYRINAPVVLQVCKEREALQQFMLRYTYAVMQEVIQVALCNKHHNLEQRLCRWLLMAMDRIGRDQIRVTQWLIAHMLGVRREGVTETAGKLEDQGIIRRTRGAITIVNRDAMKAKSCECYEALHRHYARALADHTNDDGSARSTQLGALRRTGAAGNR